VVRTIAEQTGLTVSVARLRSVVADVDASKRFYAAVLGALGLSIGGTGPDFFWVDELFVSSKDSKAAAGKLTGRTHFAFQAPTKESVTDFYEAGLAAGAKDNGPPGDRPYHPGYFACFLLDPDGNNVEAVFHGTAHRSAPSVVLKL
jgi:catechol 2,3-dioxygenase-like lactoylglutathione lyase family enzyme